MNAQGETESLIFGKTIGVPQLNGLSSNHIDSRRTPNFHSHPSTVVLENNFPERNPSVFCKFHRQGIGTCNGTFDYRYNSVWFEIVNACHAHSVNMTVNGYHGLFGFLSSYRELGRCCNNIINNIFATKNLIDSLLVAFKNRRGGGIPRRVISANKIHFRG